MGLNKCPHCHEESNDLDFCDACGRSLVIQLETVSIEGKWMEDALPCLTTITSSNLEEQLKGLPLTCIDKPFSSTFDGVNYKNYYDVNKKSLEQFLMEQESLNFEIVDKAVYSISKIFREVNAAGYVIGGIDLGDFWLQEDRLETLVYRPLKPLLTAGSVCREPEMCDFYSQEYMNKKELTFSSDVFIIGSIFTALLYGRLNAFTTIGEMRYVAHQIIAQRDDFPIELYPWLNRSTNIYEEERYTTVERQMDDYDNFLKIGDCETYSDIQIAASSDVGNNKRKFEGEESELNQDRFFYIKGEHGVFSLVADGISTAKIGSGSIAAQTVKDFASAMWEREQATLNSEEAIEAFLERFVQQANEAVVTKSSELAESFEDVRSSHLMGTTLVAAISLKEFVYTVSIGDSRIYHWSPESSLKLLHSDQNVRNEMLLNHVDWEEIRSTEEQASLIYYLGMAEMATRPFTAKNIPVAIRKHAVSSEDLILLCSDGLTDYLNPIGYQNDVWKADSILEETLAQFAPQQDWDACVCRLIELANDNGGGDNITVLILAFNKELSTEFEEEQQNG